ncbi:hypothetical protein evm_010881 [Chilo suppressalis]|nr:hypothetical protein evm_010881 [Chilo suppressalis]
MFTLNLSVFFLVAISAPKTSQRRTPQITLSVLERVNLLKYQISEQIKEKQQKKSDLITPVMNVEDDDYQYVDLRNKPITPINEFDERKKDYKFQLREIITPSTELPKTPSLTTPNKPIHRMRKKKKGKKKKRILKPVETFYRRIYNEDILYRPMKLLHCQELFTPILTGHRKNFSTIHTGVVYSRDLQVKRIIHLLGKNSSAFAKEEVTSLLYQISNLPIRLFEWDVSAVNILLQTITKGKDHTWRNLKLGISEMVYDWKLDLSNTSALLSQAKIYRPPCVTTTGYEGSTKTSSGVKYSKITTTKTTCAPKTVQKLTDDIYDYNYK